MTNTYEESLMPESIHTALITLQCAVMSSSEQQVAGETAHKLIEIAKHVADDDVKAELDALRDVVNDELRHIDRDQFNTYSSLKGLAKCF